ncbi:hypothetical protein QFC19_001399 [Naganishia cerealis]|uniref:Uncharacterized protein n=1 Tax=Naganishia cerealis TaxID=610337 RepID=A0ACC2WGI0_9TREE|nr:hypothetical protein QFC19_001399 [Naganishia cerealis]
MLFQSRGDSFSSAGSLPSRNPSRYRNRSRRTTTPSLGSGAGSVTSPWNASSGSFNGSDRNGAYPHPSVASPSRTLHSKTRFPSGSSSRGSSIISRTTRNGGPSAINLYSISESEEINDQFKNFLREISSWSGPVRQSFWQQQLDDKPLSPDTERLQDKRDIEVLLRHAGKAEKRLKETLSKMHELEEANSALSENNQSLSNENKNLRRELIDTLSTLDSMLVQSKTPKAEIIQSVGSVSEETDDGSLNGSTFYSTTSRVSSGPEEEEEKLRREAGLRNFRWVPKRLRVNFSRRRPKPRYHGHSQHPTVPAQYLEGQRQRYKRLAKTRWRNPRIEDRLARMVPKAIIRRRDVPFLSRKI